MMEKYARVINVIETSIEVRMNDNKIRIVRQYWSVDGKFLAENDPLVTGDGEIIPFEGEEKDGR